MSQSKYVSVGPGNFFQRALGPPAVFAEGFSVTHSIEKNVQTAVWCSKDHTQQLIPLSASKC